VQNLIVISAMTALGERRRRAAGVSERMRRAFVGIVKIGNGVGIVEFSAR
jgi:hypothetical protein